MNLEKAERAIKIDWILTLIIVGGGNIILTISYAMGGAIQDIVLWNWIDLFLPFVFAFFIYRKSRIGAGIWLVYYLVTQLLGWLDSGVTGPPIAPIILLYFFFQGFRGTLATHQLQEESSNPTVT